MVEYEADTLSRSLKALADPTRREILSRLSGTELTVGVLAEPFNMSLAAVSKHLKVLEQAQLVEKVRDGTSYRCRANLAPLAEVTELLERLGSFWRGRLDQLEEILK